VSPPLWPEGRIRGMRRGDQRGAEAGHANVQKERERNASDPDRRSSYILNRYS